MGDASVLITPHRFPEYLPPLRGERDLQRPVHDFPPRRAGLDGCAGGTSAAWSGATSGWRTASSPTRSTSTTGPSGSRACTSSQHKGGGVAPWNLVTLSFAGRRHGDGRRRPARLLPFPPRAHAGGRRYDWRAPGYLGTDRATTSSTGRTSRRWTRRRGGSGPSPGVQGRARAGRDLRQRVEAARADLGVRARLAPRLARLPGIATCWELAATKDASAKCVGCRDRKPREAQLEPGRRPCAGGRRTASRSALPFVAS